LEVFVEMLKKEKKRLIKFLYLDNFNFKMDKNIILLCLALLILLPTGLAYKTGETLNWTQGCPNSTYANITAIYLEDGSQTFLLKGEYSMTEFTDDFYEYNFDNTTREGQYRILGHCDIDGIKTPFAPLVEMT